MIKPFNTKGWKRWRKANFHKDEIAEYMAIQNKQTDRIILFSSADEMIRNFKHNHVHYGGKAWTHTGNMATNGGTKHVWRFGEDFETRNKTNRALEVGEAAEKYNSLKEKITEELFDQFPELYDLTAKATEKRNRRAFADDGDELEMDRFFNQEDNAWQKKKKQDTTVLAARFYIDICVSGGTSTEVLTKNLIYSLVMAEIVQRSGLATEIIVGATSHRPTDDTRLYNVSVVAKHHDEPFDINRIISLALPGVFREYCFGVWSNLTDGGPSYSLGRVCSSDEKMQPILDVFDADVSIRGGDACMRKDQLRVLIDKIAHLLKISLNGTGTAYGDGESEVQYSGFNMEADDDGNWTGKYNRERAEREAEADTEAEEDDDSWWKSALDDKDDDDDW